MTATTILRGHTSSETAYVVDDYPYGFTLRCRIRYWLERKAGFGYRLMSQTTNPKVAGEVWNKPRAGTYVAGMARMFKDQAGHVQWTVFRGPGDSPEGAERFLERLGHLFNEADRCAFRLGVLYSRKANPNCWARWDAAHPEASDLMRPTDPQEKLYAQLEAARSGQALNEALNPGA